MQILKIVLYAVWVIAFVAWIASFILRIKRKDENMTNYMCIWSIIMLSIALVNSLI